jgi:two-component system cell cycle response regulator DivK
MAWNAQQKIRALADPKKSKIPIVAITGNARNYTMEEFNKVGINEYLPKPLNFDSLVETVKNLTS